MDDDTPVPPRWYLKKVPKHIRDQVLAGKKTAKTKKQVRNPRVLFKPTEPPIVELTTVDISDKIREDINKAKALLSEFGLADTNMRKNVR